MPCNICSLSQNVLNWSDKTIRRGVSEMDDRAPTLYSKLTWYYDHFLSFFYKVLHSPSVFVNVFVKIV